MAIERDGAALRQFRTLIDAGTLTGDTDGQLLERYATGSSEAAEVAFEALVERHGPMVLRVCRGVLADPHDAQDAVQATFLVLIQKARSLWVLNSLGPWLYQVAYRTACCARSDAARRRRHEQRAAGNPAAEQVSDSGGLPEQWEQVLHEEIARLPPRYRATVVLCDLERRTTEQAARHLGCPVGTVKSRLARGRERLRGRLLRRGVAPLVGTSLGLVLSPEAVSASLASMIRDPRLQAGLRVIAGNPSGAARLPARVVTLTSEVLKAMMLSRLRTTAVVAVTVAVVTLGALRLERQTRAERLPLQEADQANA